MGTKAGQRWIWELGELRTGRGRHGGCWRRGGHRRGLSVDTTRLFIGESRDKLDTTTSCQTTDDRLGDTLDVTRHNFVMVLGATFSKSFSSLAPARHGGVYKSKAGQGRIKKLTEHRTWWGQLGDCWRLGDHRRGLGIDRTGRNS